MRTIRRAKAGATLAALVVVAAAQAASDDVSVRRKATLEFRVVATWSGGATHSIGFLGTGPVEEGGSIGGSMQVKRTPTGEGSPCGSDVTTSPVTALTPQGALPLWQVEGTVRRAEIDDIQIEYAWKRRSEGEAATSPNAAGRGKAHLSEGGRALLDFVPAFEASSGCWQNLALELSASIPEDATFKDRRIGYDLWLVSEDHGRRLTRRLLLIGKQGESVAFDYGMFRSTLPVAPRPDAGSGLMETNVTGSIRSRLQPDGSIEVLLWAHREARPSDRIWATSAYGSKRVRARAGETLRLELPPPKAVDRVDEPATFGFLAEQHIALVLTPTLME